MTTTTTVEQMEEPTYPRRSKANWRDVTPGSFLGTHSWPFACDLCRLAFKVGDDIVVVAAVGPIMCSVCYEKVVSH